MKKFNQRNIALGVVFTLLVSLVIGVIGASSFSAEALAAPVTSEIKVAHISDLHYFPFEDCNVDLDILNDPIKYGQTDFYNKMCTDTKLCREAGTILHATFLEIIAEQPDYVVVSGDLTRDSERQAHSDVANGLRWLQNKVRAIEGKENFQIFVVPGNHDLVNTSASKFNNEGNRATSADGKIIPGTALAIDVVEFKYIYAGLGYPNLDTYSAEKQAEITSTYVSHSEEYGLFAKDEYITSTTANNVSISYYGDVIGYPTKSNKAINCLSYVAICNDTKTVVCGIDSTERDKSSNRVFNWEHKTGGRITDGLISWIETETASARANDYTTIATLHHNVLPHYTMEENFTKDFTLYNWEDTADALADRLNVRYTFTGHMHASDQNYHTTYSGNTLIDFETGSTVSLKSPSRYTTITRTEFDNKVYEDVNSLVVPIEDISTVQSFHINTSDAEKIYFNNLSDLTTVFEDKMYYPLIDHLVDGYVNDNLPTFLYDLVEGILPEKISIITLPKAPLMKIVNVIIQDVAFNLEYVLGDKEYENLMTYAKGLVDDLLGIIVYEDPQTNEEYTLEKVGVELFMGHLIGGEALSYEEFAPKFKAICEQLLTEDMEINLVKKLADKLLGALITKDNSLIPQLLNHKFIISDIEFTAQEQIDINKLYGALKQLIGLDLASTGYICIGEIVELPFIEDLLGSLLGLDLGDATLLEWALDQLDKYLTTSFYTGLGGIVSNIVISFGTDATPDVLTADRSVANYKEVYRTAVNNGLNMGAEIGGKKIGTAYDSAKHFTPATYADGRLPSHATATFGTQTDTSVNLSFYTNHSVGGKIVYRKKGATDWTNVSVDTKLQAIRFPLIDVGLFATYTDIYTDDKETVPATFANRESVLGSVKFANVHSATISGLDANTEYEYKLIGTFDDKEYSDFIRSFKTAKAVGDKTSFDVLAITDIQAMLKSDYENALQSIKSIDKNYDFIVNCGDVVDSGKNIAQWSFSQNILAEVWGNSLTVISAGNHEDDYGALDAYYDFGNVPTQDTTTGVYYSFNYGNAHFAVVNTNNLDKKTGSLSEDQLTWLTADLAAAKQSKANGTIDWIIVMQHKGLYSAGSHSYDGDVIALRAGLTPLYFSNGVDLVLQGHDHVYNTTEFLDKNGNPVKVREQDKEVTSPQGVLYITLGTIGNKYYEFRENEFVTDINNPDYTYEDTLSKPTYVTLNFNGKVLTINNYMLGNDSFNNKIVINNGASVTLGTEVVVTSVKFAGQDVSNGSTLLATANSLLGALNVARTDYGFTSIKLNGTEIKSNINTVLADGVNEIELTVIPENGDVSKAQVITFSVYMLKYDLKINGEVYKIGQQITLPAGTKEITHEYLGSGKEDGDTILVGTEKPL